MPVSVKVGGAWKTATAVFNKVGGVWKTAADMPVKIGGVWKTGILASNSFESIVSGTATSSAGITLSSLPQTYKHLQIRVNWTTTGGQLRLYLNNSSTSFHRLTGTSSSVSAQYFTSNEIMATIADLEGSYPGVAIIDILDYASTTKNKTVRIFSGNMTAASGQVGFYSQLYTATDAITSIKFDTNGSGVTGRVAIYGIKG